MPLNCNGLLRLFEKVGRPDSVPLKENKFNIDASISETTLLVFVINGIQPTRVITRRFNLRRHRRT